MITSDLEKISILMPSIRKITISKDAWLKLKRELSTVQRVGMSGFSDNHGFENLPIYLKSIQIECLGATSPSEGNLDRDQIFDMGYEHGKRDGEMMPAITKNMGLWFPIGCLIGLFIGWATYR